MAVGVRTRRFSVEEFHLMVRAGILKEDDRVELIAGEITEMTPIGPRHSLCVARLTHRLVGLVHDQAIVWVQNPIRLDPHSEPQPDLALVRPPLTRYTDAHPGPSELFLVIEVADTSAQDDRSRKVPLYARAGIREAWLVDLPSEAIEVYRTPRPEGYQDVRKLERGHHIAPEAFPDLTLRIDDILG